jgi:cell division protein FtsB
LKTLYFAIGDFPMREFIGAVIVLNGIVFSIYLLAEKKTDWKGFMAVSLVAVLAGVVIANLPYISQLAVSGGKSAVTVQIQRQVEHVDTKAQEVETLAGEVKDMRDQIKLLVQNANDTNEQINESKAIVTQLITDAKMIRTQITQDRQDISQTSEHLRQTWISFIEAFYFSTQTRNIFPPPQAVTQHIIDSRII